ncbi:MAG: hypothetical protein PHE61_00115 [Candidatus Omnitrophica bacterium]|nr:hypothetical protein [Candidatus Omnitrophota bacterium]
MKKTLNIFVGAVSQTARRSAAHSGNAPYWLRVVALSVAAVFSFQTVVWSAPNDKVAKPNLEALPFTLATDPYAITVPQNLGFTGEVFKGDPKKGIVIYIQDAHCLYEAQKSIVSIIDHFKAQGASLIATEGGSGKFDVLPIQAFPNKELKGKILDRVMAKGEISGTEYSAMCDETGAGYYALEDTVLYEDDRTAFLRAQEAKAGLLDEINRMRKSLDVARDKIYSGELKQFDAALSNYKEGKISLIDLICVIRDKSVEKKLFLARYPKLASLIQNVNAEEKADGSDSKRFRQFIDKAEAALSQFFAKDRTHKEKQRELARIKQSYQIGRASRFSYARELFEVLRKLGLEEGPQSEMKDVFDFPLDIREMQGTELFSEIKSVSKEIKSSMFKGEDDKTLDSLYERLSVLENIAKLELARDDFAEYEKSRGLYDIKVFNDFLSKFGEKTQFKLDLKWAERFYELAIKREEVIYNNFEDLVSSEKAKAAILVTGGFHKQGITRHFRENNISYIIVSPSFSNFDDSSYLRVMRGEYTLNADKLEAEFARRAPRSDYAHLHNSLVTWRVRIIDEAMKQGKIAEAGRYTRYVDDLFDIIDRELSRYTIAVPVLAAVGEKGHEEFIKAMMILFADDALLTSGDPAEYILGQLNDAAKQNLGMGIIEFLNKRAGEDEKFRKALEELIRTWPEVWGYLSGALSEKGITEDGFRNLVKAAIAQAPAGRTALLEGTTVVARERLGQLGLGEEDIKGLVDKVGQMKGVNLSAVSKVAYDKMSPADQEMYSNVEKVIRETLKDRGLRDEDLPLLTALVANLASAAPAGRSLGMKEAAEAVIKELEAKKARTRRAMTNKDMEAIKGASLGAKVEKAAEALKDAIAEKTRTGGPVSKNYLEEAISKAARRHGISKEDLEGHLDMEGLRGLPLPSATGKKLTAETDVSLAPSGVTSPASAPATLTHEPDEVLMNLITGSEREIDTLQFILDNNVGDISGKEKEYEDKIKELKAKVSALKSILRDKEKGEEDFMKVPLEENPIIFYAIDSDEGIRQEVERLVNQKYKSYVGAEGFSDFIEECILGAVGKTKADFEASTAYSVLLYYDSDEEGRPRFKIERSSREKDTVATVISTFVFDRFKAGFRWIEIGVEPKGAGVTATPTSPELPTKVTIIPSETTAVKIAVDKKPFATETAVAMFGSIKAMKIVPQDSGAIEEAAAKVFGSKENTPQLLPMGNFIGIQGMSTAQVMVYIFEQPDVVENYVMREAEAKGMEYSPALAGAVKKELLSQLQSSNIGATREDLIRITTALSGRSLGAVELPLSLEEDAWVNEAGDSYVGGRKEEIIDKVQDLFGDAFKFSRNLENVYGISGALPEHLEKVEMKYFISSTEKHVFKIRLRIKDQYRKIYEKALSPDGELKLLFAFKEGAIEDNEIASLQVLQWTKFIPRFGSPYRNSYVEEWIDGLTVKDAVKIQPLSPKERETVVSTYIQLGIQNSKAKGREEYFNDVHPNNIMFRGKQRDPENPDLVVVDLGLLRGSRQRSKDFLLSRLFLYYEDRNDLKRSRRQILDGIGKAFRSAFPDDSKLSEFLNDALENENTNLKQDQINLVRGWLQKTVPIGGEGASLGTAQAEAGKGFNRRQFFVSLGALGTAFVLGVGGQSVAQEQTGSIRIIRGPTGEYSVLVPKGTSRQIIAALEGARRKVKDPDLKKLLEDRIMDERLENGSAFSSERLPPSIDTRIYPIDFLMNITGYKVPNITREMVERSVGVSNNPEFRGMVRDAHNLLKKKFNLGDEADGASVLFVRGLDDNSFAMVPRGVKLVVVGLDAFEKEEGSRADKVYWIAQKIYHELVHVVNNIKSPGMPPLLDESLAFRATRQILEEYRNYLARTGKAGPDVLGNLKANVDGQKLVEKAFEIISSDRNRGEFCGLINIGTDDFKDIYYKNVQVLGEFIGIELINLKDGTWSKWIWVGPAGKMHKELIKKASVGEPITIAATPLPNIIMPDSILAKAAEAAGIPAAPAGASLGEEFEGNYSWEGDVDRDLAQGIIALAKLGGRWIEGPPPVVKNAAEEAVGPRLGKDAVRRYRYPELFTVPDKTTPGIKGPVRFIDPAKGYETIVVSESEWNLINSGDVEACARLAYMFMQSWVASYNAASGDNLINKREARLLGRVAEHIVLANALIGEVPMLSYDAKVSDPYSRMMARAIVLTGSLKNDISRQLSELINIRKEVKEQEEIVANQKRFAEGIEPKPGEAVRYSVQEVPSLKTEEAAEIHLEALLDTAEIETQKIKNQLSGLNDQIEYLQGEKPAAGNMGRNLVLQRDVLVERLLRLEDLADDAKAELTENGAYLTVADEPSGEDLADLLNAVQKPLRFDEAAYSEAVRRLRETEERAAKELQAKAVLEGRALGEKFVKDGFMEKLDFDLAELFARNLGALRRNGEFVSQIATLSPEQKSDLFEWFKEHEPSRAGMVGNVLQVIDGTVYKVDFSKVELLPDLREGGPEENLLRLGDREGILAHGVSLEKGGVVNLLSIMLDGRIKTGKSGVVDYSTLNKGTTQTPTSAGPFGPLYVVLRRNSEDGKLEDFFGKDIPASFHEAYLVPNEATRSFYEAAIKQAGVQGLITDSKEKELLAKLKTYKAFIDERNAAQITPGASLGFKTELQEAVRQGTKYAHEDKGAALNFRQFLDAAEKAGVGYAEAKKLLQGLAIEDSALESVNSFSREDPSNPELKFFDELFVYVDSQGETQGCCLIEIDRRNNTGNLKWLFVKKDARDGGLGSFLMGVFFGELKEYGMTKATISAYQDAFGFYQKYLGQIYGARPNVDYMLGAGEGPDGNITITIDLTKLTSSSKPGILSPAGRSLGMEKTAADVIAYYMLKEVLPGADIGIKEPAAADVVSVLANWESLKHDRVESLVRGWIRKKTLEYSDSRALLCRILEAGINEETVREIEGLVADYNAIAPEGQKIVPDKTGAFIQSAAKILTDASLIYASGTPEKMVRPAAWMEAYGMEPGDLSEALGLSVNLLDVPLDQLKPSGTPAFFFIDFNSITTGLDKVAQKQLIQALALKLGQDSRLVISGDSDDVSNIPVWLREVKSGFVLGKNLRIIRRVDVATKRDIAKWLEEAKGINNAVFVMKSLETEDAKKLTEIVARRAKDKLTLFFSFDMAKQTRASVNPFFALLLRVAFDAEAVLGKFPDIVKSIRVENNCYIVEVDLDRLEAIRDSAAAIARAA